MYYGDMAQTQGDKPAFVMARSGEEVTFSQLNDLTNQGAQLFRSMGLQTGDHIAIFMENNIHYLELCIAAARCGLYYTCISSRLTTSEVDYIVGDCHARAFITSTAKSQIAEELLAHMPKVEFHLMVNGAIDGYEAYETRRDAMPSEPIPDETPGMDMLYSSGTTGRPKGIKVPLPQGKVGDDTRLTALVQGLYGFDKKTIYLSPAPLYHAAPLRYNLTVLALGGTSIIMEEFDPEQALAYIQQYQATHSQWVPTMFVKMLKLPEEARLKYDVSSIKVAIHAAAPCPIPVKEQMIDWWGPVVHEYYAGSEGNGFCAINSDEWLQNKGSVGKSLMGEIHIVGEDGEECPAGTAGTIYFSGGGQFAYHNDPEKTQDSYNDKGWSTLGDVGMLNDEGYLFLTDRKAFMIISGGVNIYPQEAENRLITHPKVADVAVIGAPNEDFGEEVKAVVQPMDWSDAGEALEQELIEYCLAELSKIKCPRSVDFRKELPRHPTGKLYKRLIRDEYWGNKDSKIV